MHITYMRECEKRVLQLWTSTKIKYFPSSPLELLLKERIITSNIDAILNSNLYLFLKWW